MQKLQQKKTEKATPKKKKEEIENLIKESIKKLNEYKEEINKINEIFNYYIKNLNKEIDNYNKI